MTTTLRQIVTTRAQMTGESGPRPPLLDDNTLRRRVAATVAEVKAYDLVAFCEKIGLAPGEDEEAWASKTRYVLCRLEDLSRAELLEVADRALALLPSFAFEETVELARQGSEQQVSELTRRAILDHLEAAEDLDQLGGKLALVEFLGRVWPLEKMRSEDHRFRTAAGEIEQHTVMNPGDYSFHYLLAKRLGLLEGSDRLFLRFVEALVHPLVRDGDRQRQLVTMLNEKLAPDGVTLVATELLSGQPIYRARARSGGVAHAVKNLIFAADGPKPDLVLADAVSNEIRIVRNAEHCLVFDEPIPPEGLTWADLLAWWGRHQGTAADARETEKSLYQRLKASLDPAVEQPFLFQYLKQYRPRLGGRLPALVPQVYLHYDPLTVRQRARAAAAGPGSDGLPLPRQRMDFLILLSPRDRIVLELDGKQHYATGDRADPRRYAEMVAADRDVRLAGYEVYRFGGHELQARTIAGVVRTFFDRLFRRHGIL